MAGTYLLVWDAPNMDMGLGAILGGRPTAAYRPRFDAIGRWLVDLAFDNDATPEATRLYQRQPRRRRRHPPLGRGYPQRRLRRLRQAKASRRR